MPWSKMPELLASVSLPDAHHVGLGDELLAVRTEREELDKVAMAKTDCADARDGLARQRVAVEVSARLVFLWRAWGDLVFGKQIEPRLFFLFGWLSLAGLVGC